MVDKKKKVIGAAAGVAAAATAAGLAAAKLRGAKPTTFHVRPREKGWAVETDGAERAASTHRTKRQAVKAGRTLATENTPSRLVIHRGDGSIQKEHSYAAE